MENRGKEGVGLPPHFAGRMRLARLRLPLARHPHLPPRGARPCATSPMADLAEALPAGDDVYHGVVVDPSALPTDVPSFAARLDVSLKVGLWWDAGFSLARADAHAHQKHPSPPPLPQHWTAAGRKGVWLKLPLANAALLPAAVDAGFAPHHAEPGYVMLTKWLPSTPSKLPANASHQVGAGDGRNVRRAATPTNPTAASTPPHPSRALRSASAPLSSTTGTRCWSSRKRRGR